MSDKNKRREAALRRVGLKKGLQFCLTQLTYFYSEKQFLDHMCIFLYEFILSIPLPHIVKELGKADPLKEYATPITPEMARVIMLLLKDFTYEKDPCHVMSRKFNTKMRALINFSSVCILKYLGNYACMAAAEYLGSYKMNKKAPETFFSSVHKFFQVNRLEYYKMDFFQTLRIGAEMHLEECKEQMKLELLTTFELILFRTSERLFILDTMLYIFRANNVRPPNYFLKLREKLIVEPVTSSDSEIEENTKKTAAKSSTSSATTPKTSASSSTAAKSSTSSATTPKTSASSSTAAKSSTSSATTPKTSASSSTAAKSSTSSVTTPKTSASSSTAAETSTSSAIAAETSDSSAIAAEANTSSSTADEATYFEFIPATEYFTEATQVHLDQVNGRIEYSDKSERSIVYRFCQKLEAKTLHEHDFLEFCVLYTKKALTFFKGTNILPPFKAFVIIAVVFETAIQQDLISLENLSSATCRIVKRPKKTRKTKSNAPCS